MLLSERIQRVSPSMTMVIAAKSMQLRMAGEDVIGLGSGEPDFNTPEHICEAANKAIKDGITRYTAVDGLPTLKQAIIAKFQRENQLSYEPDEIIVNSGAKQGIYNLCQVLLNEGDEAIIPAPYWVSYPDVVKLAQGTPVIVHCDAKQNFKMTAMDLERAITPKTKLVFLNSPNNPTGKIYTREELTELAQVLLKHPNIYIISDDIYEHLRYIDSEFHNILNVAAELRERVIVVNGVSKSYAMTGWRIGYCAGSKTIIAATKKIQGQSTSNPCSIAQMAALAALEGSNDCVKEMVKTFRQRNEMVSQWLSQIEGISIAPAEGSFYLFVGIEKLMHELGVQSDLDYCERLLDQQKIALVPGTAFGMNGFVRLSFATSSEQLREGVDRIKLFASSTKN